MVSNPPFSKRDRIFEKLYEWDLPFALIMNFNGLFDSQKRASLFRHNNVELLVPYGRMKFVQREKGMLNSPNFQSVYVCNHLLEKQITFDDTKFQRGKDMKYTAKECTCWIEYPNENHKKASGKWKCVDDYVCLRPLSVRKCKPPCKDFAYGKTKCRRKDAEMTITELFALNVYTLCKRNGLKIGEVEEKAGVCIGYISRVKSGGGVSFATAFRFAKILNVSLDDLATDIRFKELQEIADEYGFRLVEKEGNELSPDEREQLIANTCERRAENGEDRVN